MRAWRLSALGAVLVAAACANDVETTAPEGPLGAAFHAAAREHAVPRDLLVATAWVQSRFQDESARAVDVDGEHAPARVGLMGLPAGSFADADVARQIDAAARLVASLRAPADKGEGMEAWRDALARYATPDDADAGALFADAVLAVVHDGVRALAFTGELLVIEGRGKRSTAKAQALVAGADSELVARWLPARSGHWHSGRSRALDRVVIHTTEGSYDGAISWFRSADNPYSTSAHYVIRSSDGEITQMVREADTAYHARDWNSRAIGIEHEAISSNPAWFTEEMYRSSARLVRDICDRWGIPMDRQHIVGHVEVPGNDHTDPGRHWDWDYFMSLVQGPVDGSTPPPPSTPPPSPPPADGCDGLDYYGTCDGALLRWCEDGAPRSADCGASGQSCGWQDDAIGNNCLDDVTQDDPVQDPPEQEEPEPQPTPEDPCQGIDYDGACDGSTLVWCDAEALHRYDCATTGEVCGWQDDEVGNNCLAAPPDDPCNGETWFGRCDGDTLVWCADEEVRTAECGSCGWQDEDVGYNCL
ncbi:MAG: N-acetylmuramoyl-L-alanine amidase [Deltaproteobacteria bacterium]|nr:N-acetylmuramoyl-L-alanine amidase [Deltaproteobacteria bacterium]